MLVTKKTAATLGQSIHDGVGSKVSVFARRQMEKMGWQEGKGLGKNENGISKHIKATKKDDNSGLGLESVVSEEVTENWWHDSFSKQLKTFLPCSTGKKQKLKKSERTSKKNSASDVEAPPSYAELFAATGGARLGMRARASQKGKILRTEGGTAATDPQTDISVALEPEVKRKKKSRRTDDAVALLEDERDEVMDADEPEVKRKKKSRRTDDALALLEDERDEVMDADEPEVKRKKKSRSVDTIALVKEDRNDVTQALDPETKRKKKSRTKDI
jgi:Pin2-interacting protein X1